MRIALIFSSAFFVAFVAVGAVAIFGFDYFERAWGKWNSLQVYVWLAVPFAAAAGAGAFGGSRVIKASLVGLGNNLLVRPALLFSLTGTSILWLVDGPALGVGGGALTIALASAAFVAFWFRTRGTEHVQG